MSHIQLKHYEKLSWRTTFGAITVKEPIFRCEGNHRIRELARVIGVKSGSCSMVLQRKLVDFGIEESFAKSAQRVKEHYGIQVPISTIRNITLRHAGQVSQKAQAEPKVTTLPSEGKKNLLAQIDGSMLPLVRTYQKEGSKRKGREVYWAEARLALAYPQGNLSTHYAMSLEGGPEAAGNVWAQVVKKAGWAMNSHIHIVADGAPWIAEQSKIQFGKQGSFLLDFYHVSEYLGKVSQELVQPDPNWLSQQQQKLRLDRSLEVLKDLEKLMIPGNAAYKAHQYISARKHQLNYKQAIQKDLPIGSGRIESAHRHILQDRLKKPGAWWLKQNAEKIAQLRVLRSNQQWDFYWACLQAS